MNYKFSFVHIKKKLIFLHPRRNTFDISVFQKIFYEGRQLYPFGEMLHPKMVGLFISYKQNNNDR